MVALRTDFRLLSDPGDQPVQLPPGEFNLRMHGLQKFLDRVRRSRQHRPVAFLHDRPLNKVRVFHHQVEEIIVGELFLRQAELVVQIFLGSQHVFGR